jgi:hypothetical protein
VNGAISSLPLNFEAKVVVVDDDDFAPDWGGGPFEATIIPFFELSCMRTLDGAIDVGVGRITSLLVGAKRFFATDLGVLLFPLLLSCVGVVDLIAFALLLLVFVDGVLEMFFACVWIA